jgi:hypothetical protein
MCFAFVLRNVSATMRYVVSAVARIDQETPPDAARGGGTWSWASAAQPDDFSDALPHRHGLQKIERHESSSRPGARAVHSPVAKSNFQKVRSTRQASEYVWEESAVTERLPVEPDAMFSLRIQGREQESRFAHFFDEAGRGTMTSTDMLKKLRAYFHFIKRQHRHKESFGIHPVRAVLIETSDEARALRLMQLVNHPIECGAAKRAGLFWFTLSSLFAETETENPTHRTLRRYLGRPETALEPIWALPDLTMHILTDTENYWSR